MFLWHAFFLALLTLSTARPGPTRVADRSQNSTGMSIIAYDYFLSLDRRVVSIDWEVLGCGEYKLSGYHPQGTLADSTQCGPFNQAVDIYFNDLSNKVLSYDPNNLPVDPIQGPLLIRNLVSFRTKHELHPSGHSLDSYIFHAFAFAIDPVTNLPVDIAQFAIADSLDGFTTLSRVSRAPAGGTNDSATMEFKPVALEVKYRPPQSPGALTMCALVTTWTLTLISVYVSLVAVTEGRVNLATIILHAFTALAILGLWGGRFGGRSFDSFGFYVQITTVSICSIVLLRVAANPTLASWRPEKS